MVERVKDDGFNYIKYTFMDQPQHEQHPLDYRFVHQGELDAAQGIDGEISEEAGEGYAALDRELASAEAEQLRAVNERALQIADVLFRNCAKALHGSDIEEMPEVIGTILAKGESVNTWLDRRVHTGEAATREEAELAFLRTRTNNAADHAASDVKYANRVDDYRGLQNKASEEARRGAIPPAERDLTYGKITHHFGETLEEISRRLEERRYEQRPHVQERAA